MTSGKDIPAAQESIAASLDRAAACLRRHVEHPHRSEPLGLLLNRSTVTTPLVYTKYAPSLSVVLSGRKRVIVGDDDTPWGRERFLITPVDLPVFGSVIALGEEGDFLSATWRLDPMVIAEVASRLPRRASDAPPERLGTMTPQLAEAIDRLFRLLDTPEEQPVLVPLLEREITLRLLQTDQAARVLAAADSARADIVASAAKALSSDLSGPWTLNRLAEAAGTSPATLTRRFRQVTGMTPMQYLKRLRLGEARRRLLVLDDSASRAAAMVGYASAAHFSRDYRAAYEVTPTEDAHEWRRRTRASS
ncbi:AraC family transcriptional regulator N-terminal domain-containing protein [Streptomyces sp. NPDC057740]|uniref:AraC family transcriptional regulator n=1 Tax=Streptomyces sp. NPDC057740 TaxID=3346234 RepID=UPI0036CFF8F1